MLHTDSVVIRQVGMNGQISLGKEFKGKQVQISKRDDGCLIIKPGHFIPDNEKWLYEDDNLETLKESLKWAKNNPRRDNFQEIADAILKND